MRYMLVNNLPSRIVMFRYSLSKTVTTIVSIVLGMFFLSSPKYEDMISKLCPSSISRDKNHVQKSGERGGHNLC